MCPSTAPYARQSTPWRVLMQYLCLASTGRRCVAPNILRPARSQYSSCMKARSPVPVTQEQRRARWTHRPHDLREQHQQWGCTAGLQRSSATRRLQWYQTRGHLGARDDALNVSLMALLAARGAAPGRACRALCRRTEPSGGRAAGGRRSHGCNAGGASMGAQARFASCVAGGSILAQIDRQLVT